MATSCTIPPTIILALVTFLWFRKGKLWFFYDKLLNESIKQINTKSLDRVKWEELALDQCLILSETTFTALFRFEVDYLKNKIMDNQYQNWIPDSVKSNHINRTYTDKEKYCKNSIKELFYKDFRFCGLCLLYRSLKWRILLKEDTDCGYFDNED